MYVIRRHRSPMAVHAQLRRRSIKANENLSADYVRPATPLTGEPVDILLPLGTETYGADIETRYALRSIAKFATGYRNIIIVGHRPDFLAEHERIRCHGIKDTRGNHEWRICYKLIESFKQIPMAQHIAVWNDDYILTQQIDVRAIDFLQGGSLVDAACRRPPDGYQQAIYLTEAYLQTAGFGALHYDIHAPMIYERARFLSLRRWWEACEKAPNGLLIKSIYGNTQLDEPGKFLMDVKLKMNINPGKLDELRARRWIFSYGDVALRRGLAQTLERMFPEKCEFEK